MPSSLSLPGSPPFLTKVELEAKLAKAKSFLQEHQLRQIHFESDGDMRWLTGQSHQILNTLPSSPSKVQAILALTDSGFLINFYCNRLEYPRFSLEKSPVFLQISDLKTKIQIKDTPLTPQTICSRFQSTLFKQWRNTGLGTITASADQNSFKKLTWLTKATHLLLIRTLHELKEGMNGLDVKSLVCSNLIRSGIEPNLILVGLAGQENFFHPIPDSRYKLRKGTWIKIACGSRFADQIASLTVMGKWQSKIASDEKRIFAALQEAALRYAERFRPGILEHSLYRQVGRIFREVERKRKIKNFSKSAYNHHLGGPLSPNANRDYTITRTGQREILPNQVFAINPVDILKYFKIEVMGLTGRSAEEKPRILILPIPGPIEIRKH